MHLSKYVTFGKYIHVSSQLNIVLVPFHASAVATFSSSVLIPKVGPVIQTRFKVTHCVCKTGTNLEKLLLRVLAITKTIGIHSRPEH